MNASNAQVGEGNSEARIDKRVVVKFGTNLVTLKSGGLDESRLSDLVRQLAALRLAGSEVILVSSGAIGAGMGVLENTGRSRVLAGRRSLRSRQAAAAIGQVELMSVYRRIFGLFGIDIAQALISRNDLNNRTGYLNVRNTLERLLRWQIVPVVNENDVVGAKNLEGVLYGDNDRLSAMLANALDADLLVLLGETEGLFTADPTSDVDATLIPIVDKLTPQIMSYAGGPSDDRGSGGMRSKMEAAEVAMTSGIDLVIASGYEANVLERILSDDPIGTRFVSSDAPRSSLKRWLVTRRTEARGTIIVDAGAVTALKRGVSLLPVGVTGVAGEFERGDIVSVDSPTGAKVAYGIVNYNASEVNAVVGLDSERMLDILQHERKDEEKDRKVEIIHRDKLALV